MSGKLRAQRAKSMKFKDGYMVSSGNPVREYIDSATRHVLLRQVRLQEKDWTLSHRQQCTLAGQRMCSCHMLPLGTDGWATCQTTQIHALWKCRNTRASIRSKRFFS